MLPLIILAGPTTSKKSDTAIALAEKLDSEIIGADSMQIYKYFDIGTAKASIDDRARIPHHLIDILEPAEEFTAFDFALNNEQRRIVQQAKFMFAHRWNRVPCRRRSRVRPRGASIRNRDFIARIRSSYRRTLLMMIIMVFLRAGRTHQEQGAEHE